MARNQLARETSPYLLQHADNPVDWMPWGPEALERARRDGKPVLLSVGYAACHWCHVMAHERSEEHTSELQSLMRISYAVFCLKKKTKKHKHSSKQLITQS